MCSGSVSSSFFGAEYSHTLLVRLFSLTADMMQTVSELLIMKFCDSGKSWLIHYRIAPRSISAVNTSRDFHWFDTLKGQNTTMAYVVHQKIYLYQCQCTTLHRWQQDAPQHFTPLSFYQSSPGIQYIFPPLALCLYIPVPMSIPAPLAARHSSPHHGCIIGCTILMLLCLMCDEE